MIGGDGVVEELGVGIGAGATREEGDDIARDLWFGHTEPLTDRADRELEGIFLGFEVE